MPTAGWLMSPRSATSSSEAWSNRAAAPTKLRHASSPSTAALTNRRLRSSQARSQRLLPCTKVQ